jgi:WD40 repeat protein
MANTVRLTLLLVPLVSLVVRSALAQEVKPRTDRHGDALPKGALQRLGTLRYCQQDGAIDDFAFAPDGTTYATVANTGKGRTVRLWHTATGQEFLRLPGASSRDIRRVAFAPDGKTIAACTAEELVVWDSATGKQLRRFELPQTVINCFAWSPDGQVLAVGCERAADSPSRSVRLLDAVSGRLLRTILAHDTPITTVAFSADGKRLASCSRDVVAVANQAQPLFVGDIRLWEVATGQLLGRLQPGLSSWHIDDNDGRLVSFSADLGRTATPLLAFQSPGSWPPGPVRDFEDIFFQRTLALSPDGRWLAVSQSKVSFDAVRLWSNTRVFVWEVASGRLVRDLDHVRFDAEEIAFLPGGLVLAAGGNATHRPLGVPRAATFWDLADGRPLGRLEGHAGFVSTVGCAPDGQTLLTGGEDQTVLVWEGQCLPRAKVPALEPLSVRRLHGLWEDLAGADARKAFDALLALRAGGEEVCAYLQKRLRPAVPLSAAEREGIERLVADLDDPRYAVRARASSLLEKQGESAVPVLRKALKTGVALETRRRVELLLARLERFTPSPAELSELRALAVLEYAATPQARAVVEALAAGAPEARLTQQARAALLRWDKRPG